MAGKDVKKPAGPIKPTQPGLHIATKTTEAKAPTLVPRWGAGSSTSTPPAAISARLPRVPKPAAAAVNAGLASERARARMVERLIHQGIRNQHVLQAMRLVPRHAFVDEALSSRAYEDSALPIGHQQTISQPYVVARVIELALSLLSGTPRPLRALEVGGGCGYQAAVMSYCFDKVISVERLKVLADLARVNLRPLKRSNLRFVFGDGLVAVSKDGPFDVIVCSAGMPAVPAELLNQLAIGGALIAPIGEPEQFLVGIQRIDDQEFKSQQFDMVRYVPVLRGTE
ncbi:MAG: protein-L-isoaspartate(D-aspartate) O-methyltransferase [Betaproteobacteria bacterium]|jgi:protein-L-isoaspartate(D-aspartate) O-methyltransferase|nr:protein-L-isoaspartate(D-aspartate) O-methyltransferase [Betaproteobacteria bacterium]